jgi:hypothetical protein
VTYLDPKILQFTCDACGVFRPIEALAGACPACGVDDVVLHTRPGLLDQLPPELRELTLSTLGEHLADEAEAMLREEDR